MFGPHRLFLAHHGYVAVERPDTADDFRCGLAVICKTVLPRPTRGATAFGDWRLSAVVTDTVERYREVRRSKETGPGGTNRSLTRLRALFNWPYGSGIWMPLRSSEERSLS